MSKLRVRYQYSPVVPTHRSGHCGERPLERWSAYVYECYAADGTLLYVGRTQDRWARHRYHRRRAPWYPDLDHVLLTALACPDEASRLEQDIINERRPLHNRPLRDAVRRGWETRKGLKPPVHVERGVPIGTDPAVIRPPLA